MLILPVFFSPALLLGVMPYLLLVASWSVPLCSFVLLVRRRISYDRHVYTIRSWPVPLGPGRVIDRDRVAGAEVFVTYSRGRVGGREGRPPRALHSLELRLADGSLIRVAEGLLREDVAPLCDHLDLPPAPIMPADTRGREPCPWGIDLGPPGVRCHHDETGVEITLGRRWTGIPVVVFFGLALGAVGAVCYRLAADGVPLIGLVMMSVILVPVASVFAVSFVAGLIQVLVVSRIVVEPPLARFHPRLPLRARRQVDLDRAFEVSVVETGASRWDVEIRSHDGTVARIDRSHQPRRAAFVADHLRRLAPRLGRGADRAVAPGPDPGRW